MIRVAQVTDWKGVAELLRVFRKDPLTPPWFQGEDEHPQSQNFLVQTLSKEQSFIAIEQDEVIGMFLSVMSFVPFTTNVIVEEIAWYVREDYRHKRIGYQLLKCWEAMIDELKFRGEINFGVLHTMAHSPVDMTAHGYIKSDTTFMR